MGITRGKGDPIQRNARDIKYLRNLIASGASKPVTLGNAAIAIRIANGTLVQGTWYRISDFKTIHKQHNSTDLNITNLVVPTEPILVMANSNSTFALHAFSELHPSDLLEFIFDSSAWGDLEDALSMGFISRRTSSQNDPDYPNVSTPYDFRYCGFKRRNAQGLYPKTGLFDNYIVLDEASINVGKAFGTGTGTETWSTNDIKIASITTITGDVTGVADINVNGTDYPISFAGGVSAGIDTWITTNQAILNALLTKIVKTSTTSMDIYYPTAWANITYTETTPTTTATVLTSVTQKDEIDTFSFFKGDLEGSPAVEDIFIGQKAWHIDTGNPLINFVASTNIFRQVRIETCAISTVTHKVYHMAQVNAMTEFTFCFNAQADGYWGFHNHGILNDSIVTSDCYFQDIDAVSVHRKDGESDLALQAEHNFAGLIDTTTIIRCKLVAVEVSIVAEISKWNVENCHHVSVPMISDNPHNPAYFKNWNGERYVSDFTASFKDLAAVVAQEYPLGQVEPIEFDFVAKRSNLRTVKAVITGANNVSADRTVDGYDDFCTYWNLESINPTATITTLTGYGDREGLVRYLIPEAGLVITINNNDVANGFITTAPVVADGSNKEIIKATWNAISERWYVSLL